MRGEVMASSVPSSSSSPTPPPSSIKSPPLLAGPGSTERVVVIGGRPWLGRTFQTPGTRQSHSVAPSYPSQSNAERELSETKTGHVLSPPVRTRRGGPGSEVGSGCVGTGSDSRASCSSSPPNTNLHHPGVKPSKSSAPSSAPSAPAPTLPSSHAATASSSSLAHSRQTSSSNDPLPYSPLLALPDSLTQPRPPNPRRFPPSGSVGSSDSLQGFSPCDRAVPPLLLSTASPRKLISEENLASCPERPSGWYKARRTYRSVAYGTWKVGGARKLLTSHSDFSLLDDQVDPRLTLSQNLKLASKTPNDPKSHPRLVNSISQIESSDSAARNCLSAREPITNGFYSRAKEDYQKMFASTEDNNNWTFSGAFDQQTEKYLRRHGPFSPPLFKTTHPSSKLRMGSGNGWSDAYGCNSDNEISISSDCYSAKDYCRFQNSKLKPRRRTVSSTTEEESSGVEEDGQPSELDKSVKTVIESFNQLRQYATMRPNGKTKKRKKSHQLFHKRSASAGSPAIFSTLSPSFLPKQGPDQDLHSKTLGYSSAHKKSSVSPSTTAFNFFRKLYASSSASQQTLKQSASLASGSSCSGRTTLSSAGSTRHPHDHAGKQQVNLPLSAASDGSEDLAPRARLADLESTSLSPSPVSHSPCVSPSDSYPPPNRVAYDATSSSSSSMSLEPPKPAGKGNEIMRISKMNGIRTGRSDSATQCINHFQSWEEAYDFLRKELKSIRDRDYKILENFQSLEQELRGVKVTEEGPSPIVELPPNLENAFSTFQSPELTRPPDGKDISDVAL